MNGYLNLNPRPHIDHGDPWAADSYYFVLVLSAAVLVLVIVDCIMLGLRLGVSAWTTPSNFIASR